MIEQLEKFAGDLRAILARLLSFLPPQQKRLLFIGLPLFVSLAYGALRVVERMNYGPLYTNLSPQDGAAVVKELEAEKIPYSITGGGSVIEVPRDAIYRTRMKLAARGVPLGGGVGFEIFEKTPFGVSEFTQQVNYLRAIQGELARTINSIAAVQSSRVHVALPSRSNFLGPEEKPSASVVVDLRPGFHLSPDQVQGIVHLVASSVPKLSADRVTVIDSSGRPLKEIAAAVPATEAEKLSLLKKKYEQELQQRIETMLDPILGPGKVVVRANVQMSLQETLTTREEFDPENKVVRSQRSVSDETAVKGGVPGVQSNVPGSEGAGSAESGSKRGSEIVTYEVGRTTSRIVEPRGQIQKLSVAVLVDGRYENEKYIPRTAEELEVIKGIVKRAVGFDADRGDEIELANVPFKVQPPAPLQPAGTSGWKEMVQTPAGIGVAAGVLATLGLLGFFLLRRRGRKPPAKAPEEQPARVAPAAAPAAQEEIPAAAQKIVMAEDPRKEQLIQIARDYHDATVRIIRGWLQEEGHRGRPTGNGGMPEAPQ
ncbi:MAG TPA: flagellar basal-body MS-ring/collar protein FliF [candidate division Zixibacteria bacterium]|nr:flagellar basal-body MS-ring/collar protein FliF [candidate division Zixibacteria bacterium]